MANTMLKLKIKYSLTPEGKTYFPAWYEEVHKEVAQQDGFIDMRYETEGNIFTVYLDFESQEHLDLWASTEVHDELVTKIAPHLMKPEEVERF
jgi:antibiotic biosynthesis monooxygenase (ABM) superfamily enzyme